MPDSLKSESARSKNQLLEPPLLTVLLPVAMLLVPEPMVLGGIELEPMPPELLPMLLLSVPGVIGDALEELDDEAGDDGGVGAGLPVGGGVSVGELLSSTFLPQAPKANKVERATAARATGLKFEACM